MREKVIITGEDVEVKLIDNTGLAVTGSSLGVTKTKMVDDQDDYTPNHGHGELSEGQREEVEQLVSDWLCRMVYSIRSGLWGEDVELEDMED